MPDEGLSSGRVERTRYVGRVLTVEDIRRGLAARAPVKCATEGKSHAAVAAVIREVGGSPEILLIERAAREGDPWSGHMALPGGRIDPDDPNTRAGAERETLEEVGLDLSGAVVLGQLDDMEGHLRGICEAFIIPRCCS